MKLELSFGSFKDLKEQLQIMLDELTITETRQLDLESIYGNGSDVTVAPVIVTEEVTEPVVEAPKKRTRRTKAEIEAEKNQPVVPEVVPEVVEQAIFIAEQPVLPEVVEEPVAPKNFYSLSEFSVNFAIVLNTLLNDGSLSIGDLETACKYYDVKNIYFISKDIAMMEHYYNDLVARQIITKKGDY